MENIADNGTIKRAIDESSNAAHDALKAAKQSTEIIKDEVKNVYSVAGKVGKKVLKDAQQVGEETVAILCDSSKETVDKVQESVKERPMQSLVIAAGVGLVVGYLFARRGIP